MPDAYSCNDQQLQQQSSRSYHKYSEDCAQLEAGSGKTGQVQQAYRKRVGLHRVVQGVRMAAPKHCQPGSVSGTRCHSRHGVAVQDWHLPRHAHIQISNNSSSRTGMGAWRAPWARYRYPACKSCNRCIG